MTINQRLDSIIEIFGCTTLKWVMSLDTTHEIKAEISRELRDLLDAFICERENNFILVTRAKILFSKAENIGPSTREFADHLYWFISLLELDNTDKEELRHAA